MIISGGSIITAGGPEPADLLIEDGRITRSGPPGSCGSDDEVVKCLPPLTISDEELDSVTRSIEEFGFVQPVVARRDGVVIDRFHVTRLDGGVALGSADRRLLEADPGLKSPGAPAIRGGDILSGGPTR